MVVSTVYWLDFHLVTDRFSSILRRLYVLHVELIHTWDFRVELLHTWDFRVELLHTCDFRSCGRRGSMYRMGVRGRVVIVVLVYCSIVQCALPDWYTDQPFIGRGIGTTGTSLPLHTSSS